MRACATKFGAGSPDAVQLWSLVGRIHDFDYEKYPTAEEHPFRLRHADTTRDLYVFTTASCPRRIRS